MNTAKLVNSALTGGGLIYPENLNVIIGNEDHGYPKGYVLDANAVSSLNQTSGGGNNSGGNAKQAFATVQSLTNAIYSEGSISMQNYTFSHGVGMRNNSSNSFAFGYNGIEMSNMRIDGKKVTFTKPDSVPAEFSYLFNAVIVDESGHYVTNVESSDFINNNTEVEIKTAKNLEEYTKYYIALTNNEEGMFDFNFGSNNKIVGNSSTSFGRYNLLTGDYLTTFGEGNISNSIYNLIHGNFNQSNGTYNYNQGQNNLVNGSYNLVSGTNNKVGGDYGVVVGDHLVTYSNKESVFGTYNLSKDVSGDKAIVFSIGCGDSNENRSNAIEAKRNGDFYVKNIGGFNGKNSDTAKTLQQVISEIQNNSSSTTQPVVDNGPWDIDITSKFVKGNVNISPSAMWTINQGYKRVYLETKLNQGDIIKIPNTIRMYIGWKDTSGQFGMANWTQAGTTYTATVDGDYVILLDTPSVNNPGIEPATLSSFGKVTLHTSNVAYKPNSGGGSQTPGTTQMVVLPKDHTRDDKIMRGIAHQGYHVTERANSLAAFRAAAKEGWRYVETDTYMTSDGKFIVSHDDNVPVGYTNGTVTLTDTSYKYGDHTLADILAFHGQNGEKVDTLEDFCKLCKECGLHPYIEIKQGNMWQANTIDTTNEKYNGKPYAIKLLNIVNRYGLRGNATFISSTPYTLRLMAKQDQSYRYGIVYFGNLKITDINLTTLISKIEEFNNDTDASKAYLFVDVNIDNLKNADANIANLFVSRNCALEVWTAKTKEDLDNLDPYVTGVTSDNIHAGEILAKKI